MNTVRCGLLNLHRWLGCLLVVCSLLVVTTASTYAEIIDVTTTDDEDNVANSECSLREAIESADSDSAVGGCTAGSGVDTIELPAGLYQLTTGAELSSFGSITFQGAGRELTIVEQIPASDNRILNLNGTGVVHISGMTFQKANNATVGAIAILDVMSVNISDTAILSNTALGNGAGIFSSANITLTNSILSGNYSDDTGGAIYGNSSTITLINTVVSNNEAKEAGGGVSGQVGLVMRNSQVIDNRAGRGGGIYFTRNSLIEDSIIARNVATDTYGGGIANLNGIMVIRNSVIQENSAAEGAGGIGNAGVNFAPFLFTAMHIEDSQILSNSARSGGGIGNAGPLFITDTVVSGNSATELGGGIGNDSFVYTMVVGIEISGTLHMRNVTVANNEAGRGGGIATGGILSATASLIENNNATERGGGITIGNGIVAITDSFVRENEAPTGAGVFITYESQYGSFPSRAALDDVEITGNQGSGLAVAGGAVLLMDMTLNGQEGDNCSLTGGTVTSEGGNSSSDNSCSEVLTGPDDENGTGGEEQEQLRLPRLIVSE